MAGIFHAVNPFGTICILSQRTPYPLTATLFSTFNFEQGKTAAIRKNIIHEYDDTQSKTVAEEDNTDSTDSEREIMIPDR